MITLLDRVSEVCREPYPHVVVENALPDDYYAELVKTRPDMWKILNGRSFGNNQRFDMPTKKALELPDPWKEFVASHICKDFFRKAMELFAEEIWNLFPAWDGAASMRCQPGCNTPALETSSVRGPHLDNPSELYAGLFYMPIDDDGGDLQIYRWKNGERKYHGKLEVDPECVELVKTIPYKPNTYVMFINCPNALHGVTPRKSRNPRYLVNVIADSKTPLFKVGHNQY